MAVPQQVPDDGLGPSHRGGLVFTGDVEGNAPAFDASNGERLWSFGTGSGHRGSPISYAVGGKQYIAVPSGWGGVAARNFSSSRLLHLSLSSPCLTGLASRGGLRPPGDPADNGRAVRQERLP